MHVQTAYTRLSFLPMLIIADGLGMRLGAVNRDKYMCGHLLKQSLEVVYVLY